MEGHVEIVQLLLRKHADVDLCDEVLILKWLNYYMIVNHSPLH